jgi:hypothetical protein
MITQEEKIRVNARIPKSLYDWMSSEYDNVSQAINEGLEKLKESKTSEMSYNSKDVIKNSEPVIQDPELIIRDVIQNPEPVIHDDIQLLTANIENYKAQVRTLNDEITRLKAELIKAPDPLELVKLQERNEGLNLLLEERSKRIGELTEHKENMSRFADYFRSTEPKLIEAPAAERKKPWWQFW